MQYWRKDYTCIKIAIADETTMIFMCDFNGDLCANRFDCLKENLTHDHLRCNVSLIDPNEMAILRYLFRVAESRHLTDIGIVQLNICALDPSSASLFSARRAYVLGDATVRRASVGHVADNPSVSHSQIRYDFFFKQKSFLRNKQRGSSSVNISSCSTNSYPPCLHI